MFDDRHRYDLAFVPPKKLSGAGPEIVFIIDKGHLLELVERLSRTTKRMGSYADQYFNNYPVDFTLPKVDLFQNTEFGYGRCAYYTEHDNEVWLRVSLGRGLRVSCCSLTVNVIAQSLGVPFAKKGPGNRNHQVDIQTCADNFGSGGYGHAIGGWVSASVANWLGRYAQSHIKYHNLDGSPLSALMPEIVTKSMRTAWCSLTDKEDHHWAKDCYVDIRPTGHLTLGCFGDACDLSVYPDQTIDDYIDLGCHNLDNANQQLTLLAGLAKICELARAGS